LGQNKAAKAENQNTCLFTVGYTVKKRVAKPLKNL
jgi:hypothetical protein